MSTAKRSRRRPADGRSVSPQPDAKRLKVAKSPHASNRTGLNFLVDENARVGKKLEARLTNGVAAAKSARVDESRTVVVPDTVQDEDGKKMKHQQEIIDVSSDEDSSSIDDDAEDEDDEDDEDEDAPNGRDAEQTDGLTNGHVSEAGDGIRSVKSRASKPISSKVSAVDDAMDEDEPLDEPTFGDLLKSRHPEPIDIGGSGPTQALVPISNNRGLAPPSSTSLSTVLTQALKTNDRELLESCFRLGDLPSIRSTIQRLPSQYAATLLQRIVERIHKRPGRTGSLMVWIQWSLVAHGAYFSTQPDVMRKIKSLTRVIRERASGLQPLLHLKGKLDLLSAQLELRRSLNISTGQTDDEDDEEAVRYIEGEDEDDWSESDEDSDANVGQVQPRGARGEGPRLKMNGFTNGTANESADEMSDDDDAAEDEDEGDMLDIEAEEDSEDEDDEKDSDMEVESDEEEDEALDDEDDLSDDDEDGGEVAIKQPKHNILNRKR